MLAPPWRSADVRGAGIKRALTLFAYTSTAMDVAALASAVVDARASQIQMAIAAKMLRMNADNAASAAKLIDAAQQNLANIAAGVGANLDITV